MAWIKTIPLSEATGELLELLMKQRELYPGEYDESTAGVTGTDESIVESHTLIPAGALSRFLDLRCIDVARPSARSPAARDDRDDGLDHERLLLLSGIARRVSA